jgi:hypothetical protein
MNPPEDCISLAEPVEHGLSCYAGDATAEDDTHLKGSVCVQLVHKVLAE